MNMFRIIGAGAILAMFLTACANKPANTAESITRDEAIQLLNEGKVTAMLTTHSGWVILTLTDNTARANKVEIIGSAKQLLEECVDCSDVRVWIE
jgi:PBP1b-binding outer membrane lipoprotein LpoB